ncbi:MAG: flagellar filament capping protein FliD [Pacificimonas sp.]
MNEILATLGAGSGLNTTALVADLVAAEREPRIAQIETRREAIDARISALGQVRSGVSAFSDALDALVGSGVLGVQPQLSSDAGATVTRTGDIPVGSLEFSIERLAARQSLVSGGFASRDAALGTGRLTIDFGQVDADGAGAASAFTADPESPPLELEIGVTDDTLDGIARLINEADEGLTATVVNDGTAARLILKGPEGEMNGFTIDVAADASGSDLELLQFGPSRVGMELEESAADALLDVEGVAVTRPSNSIDDLLPGLRLDLQTADPGQRVTLSNDYDGEELSLGVRNFVGAFNEVQALMTELGGGAPGDAAPLNGSQALRRITGELSGLTTALLGGESGVTRLADIGIGSTRNGQLVVDDARLVSLISSSPESIGRLFVDSRQFDVSGIDDLSGSGDLPPGNYAFENLTVGTSGSSTGDDASGAFTVPVFVDAGNRDFLLSVDGGPARAYSLANGTYASGAQLANAFQAAVGADSRVEWDGTAFTFASDTVGSISGIEITGMDAALQTRLGLDNPSRTAGTDASGTVNGIALTGSGNTLSYVADDGTRLSFSISANITEASINIFDGLATRLSRIADAAGLPSGAIGAGLARLDRQSRELANNELRIEARSENYEERLRRQFGAMEASVAQFNSTRDFLTQQIEIWTNQNNR